MEGILNTTDIIIASFLSKLKKRAPVIEAPDLLVPGNTAKDCQMPIIRASFVEILESLRRLILRSDTKSSRANIMLVNAIISNCPVKSIMWIYSKSKAINTNGRVAKIIKNIDFVRPFFSKMV